MIKHVFQVIDDETTTKCIEVNESNNTIQLLKNNKLYKSDYIQHVSDGTELLFNKVLSSNIDLLFEGSSSLVIIYGEPGTKKRSTLFSFNNNEGLLERLINKILYLNKYKKYQVKIGLAEIRNEAVKDLIYKRVD